jgi:hypothetical protein
MDYEINQINQCLEVGNINTGFVKNYIALFVSEGLLENIEDYRPTFFQPFWNRL